MDKWGVEKACVLPIENPEETFFYVTTNEVLRMCKRYPDRFIPFCSIDPRRGINSEKEDFRWLLERYVKQGCRGFGEVLAGLYIDDPRLRNLYRQCEEFNLPILFHLGKDFIGVCDELHMPRLERILQEFPRVNFIGHGQAFWAEISIDVKEEERGEYPKGKIIKSGHLPKLLGKYANLYADTSAGSGYNALSRDLEYGKKFLEEYQDKILFGTDTLYPGQKEMENIVSLLKNIDISPKTYEKISHKNTEKLLAL